MLTKYQEIALKWLRRCCFYMEEVPIIWDSNHKQISTNPEISKWVFWWIGNAFVFILWFTCVYTLSTQWIFQRKDLSLLPVCILTTGFCCFTATLASAYGITKLRNKTYVSSVNEYIALEIKIYSKYKPDMFKTDLPIETADLFFLVGQGGNFLPYLIYIICIFWDLDGPYWVLEDIAPDPKYRNIPTILSILLIRTFLLIPGFLETCRTLIYSCMGYLCIVIYLKAIVQTLVFKVNLQRDFFRYYSHLYIISNILGPGFERATFLICTTFYFLFVQTLWICVCGFGNLDITIYLFFGSYAIVIILAAAIGLPIVARAGEVINGVRKSKIKQIEAINCSRRSFESKIFLKKVVALRSIRFSYGSFYPLGKQFSTNIFDNMVQHMLSMVLLFDLSGRRMNQ